MRLPQDPPIYWRCGAYCVLSMWSPRGPTTILIARRHCSAIAARWHVAKNNILQRWMNVNKGYKRVLNYRRLVNYLKENYYKKMLINGRLPRRRTPHTKCVNISKTVGDTRIVTVNHRLNGISTPVLTATHNSYGSLRVSKFFFGSPLEARPPKKEKKRYSSKMAHARMCLLQ